MKILIWLIYSVALSRILWLPFGVTLNVTQEQVSNPYKLHTFPLSCFAVPTSICIDHGSNIITLPACSPKLIGYWSFNYLFSVDDSGNGNHFHPGVLPGPPFFVNGASAHIQSSLPASKATITLSDPLDASFSIMFWVYVVSNPNTANNPIFLTLDSTFSLSISPSERNLIAKIADTNLISQASFLMERWTFIAITVGSHKNAIIYWNGIQDARQLISEITTKSTKQLILGSPSVESSSLELYLDELRLYQGELNAMEIQAHSLPSMTGISNPQLVHLGCIECTINDVAKPNFCEIMYRLCSKKEYFDYGFRIARLQGYLKPNQMKVWYRDAMPNAVKDINSNDGKGLEKRLALCCDVSLECLIG